MTIVINHFGTPGTTLYAGIDPLVPAVLRLYNWQDPDTPVLVDSLTFDTDIAPLTFQDSRLSAEIGSVAIKQSTESIVYGTIITVSNTAPSSPTVGQLWVDTN